MSSGVGYRSAFRLGHAADAVLQGTVPRDEFAARPQHDARECPSARGLTYCRSR